jgi:MFS transporter, MHS family, proline/betaine transporter
MLVASFVGPSHAFMQTLFPVSVRYTAISISFCIGMAITGGITPMLLTYLIDMTQNFYMPAMLLGGYAALMGVILFMKRFYLPKQKPEEEIKAMAA